MSESKPYDKTLDKILWEENCIDVGMRVTAHQYDNGAPKFSFLSIYEDRATGNLCVGSYVGKDGRRRDKALYKLSIKQIVCLHNLVQQKIQDGQL